MHKCLTISSVKVLLKSNAFTGQIIEKFESSHEGFRGWRVHEIEVDQIVDTEFLQLQHD